VRSWSSLIGIDIKSEDIGGGLDLKEEVLLSLTLGFEIL